MPRQFDVRIVAQDGRSTRAVKKKKQKSDSPEAPVVVASEESLAPAA
jgi:hypothetical protein